MNKFDKEAKGSYLYAAAATLVISWLYVSGCGGGGNTPATTSSSSSSTTSTSVTVATKWTMYGTAVTSAGASSVEYFNMPDVNLFSDGTYRLYYSVSKGGAGTEMRYAESTDALTWTVKGVFLTGASDSSDPEYFLSGPDMVFLSDGTFRQYYVTSPQQQQGSSPLFHVRSLTSSSGTSFTKESGVRINISTYDSAAELKLAGHGSYYIASNGTFVGLFSGELTSDSGASDIKMATSADGLTWSTVTTLYADWHDPIVVKKDGKYIMFASYSTTKFGYATSDDGLTWTPSSEPTEIDLYDTSGNELSESQQGGGVGDLGAVVTSSGEIILYSNYGYPSTSVAIFRAN